MRQRVAVQPLELVQQLGLAGAVRQDQQRREGDLVRQGDGEGGGEPLVGALFTRLAQPVTGSLAVFCQELHGHPRHIGLGDGVYGKRGGVGGKVHRFQLHIAVRHQAVLSLQDLLHPVGKGADLPVHAGLHPIEAVLQIHILAVHPVQTVEEMEQHQAQDQARRHEGPAAALPGRRLGGDVAACDLLHHLQLGLRQPAACFGRSRVRLRRFLHAQQPSHRDAEQAAEGDQLVDLRQGGVRLPFVDGLAGDAQLAPQGLLGQSQLLPLLRDALPNGHSPRLLSPSD